MDIIGYVFLALCLAALIVLMYLVCIPIAKIEKKERIKRTAMYDAIKKYIDYLMNE